MSKRDSRPDFSDELIGDYLDGRLDPEQEARLRASIEADTQLAARVAAYRAQDTGLRQLADSVLNEPVPDRLSRVLEGASKRSKHTLNGHFAGAMIVGAAIALAATTLDARPTGALSDQASEGRTSVKA